MYAEIDKLVGNAVFDRAGTSNYYESKPETYKHKNIEKQNVYHSAAKVGNDYYSVEIKVDVFKSDGRASYKHHGVTKIDVLPTLYRGLGSIADTPQTEGTISAISIDILNDKVKPSRIEDNTLFESGKTQTEIAKQAQKEILDDVTETLTEPTNNVVTNTFFRSLIDDNLSKENVEATVKEAEDAQRKIDSFFVTPEIEYEKFAKPKWINGKEVLGEFVLTETKDGKKAVTRFSDKADVQVYIHEKIHALASTLDDDQIERWNSLNTGIDLRTREGQEAFVDLILDHVASHKKTGIESFDYVVQLIRSFIRKLKERLKKLNPLLENPEVVQYLDDLLPKDPSKKHTPGVWNDYYKGGSVYGVAKDGGLVVPIETLLAQDDANKTAQVVEIDPSVMVDEEGKPINLKDTPAVRNWILDKFKDKEVVIKDDNSLQVFSNEGLRSNLKSKSTTNRSMYAGLDKLVENAVFGRAEPSNYDESKPETHKHKNIEKQNVYQSAARIGKNYYSVEIKIDVFNNQKPNSYKHHGIKKIDIPPTLYRDINGENATPQTVGKISAISIDILKDKVKPSRIENNTLYQLAYHGTPNELEGNRLTTKKIGTGEGAQAYGHGLYAAGNRIVSEHYANMNEYRGRAFITFRGDSYREGNGNNVLDSAIKTLARNNWNKDAAIKNVKDYIGSLDNAISEREELVKEDNITLKKMREDRHTPEEIIKEIIISKEQTEEVILEYKKQKAEYEDIFLVIPDIEQNKGHLYQVEVPEDHELLDWDKPLVEQPDKIKQILDKLLIDGISGVDPEFTGRDLYLEKTEGDMESPKAVSEHLLSLGIKGIRYLDGFSRKKGEGSHNYVVFHDDDIAITKQLYELEDETDTENADNEVGVNADNVDMGEIIRQELDKQATEMEHVTFSRDEYNRLFPEGKIKTPIETVKLGAGQFDKLKARKREYLLGAMQQTLADPIVVLPEKTAAGKSRLYIKSFTNSKGTDFVMTVVVDINDKAVAISTGERRKAQIDEKIKKTGIPLYIKRGGGQTHGTDSGNPPPLPGDTSLSHTSGEKSSNFFENVVNFR